MIFFPFSLTLWNGVSCGECIWTPSALLVLVFLACKVTLNTLKGAVYIQVMNMNIIFNVDCNSVKIRGLDINVITFYSILIVFYYFGLSFLQQVRQLIRQTVAFVSLRPNRQFPKLAPLPGRTYATNTSHLRASRGFIWNTQTWQTYQVQLCTQLPLEVLGLLNDHISRCLKYNLWSFFDEGQFRLSPGSGDPKKLSAKLKI